MQDRVKPDWRGLVFPGGHIEKGESFVQGIIREMEEETGLTIYNPKLCGIKQFQTDNDERYFVALFKTDSFSGELISSDEGEMAWFERDELHNKPIAADFFDLLRVFDEPNLNEFMYERGSGENDWVIRLY